MMTDTPFALTNEDAYRRWRDRKLATAPTRLDDLIVEIGDPRRLSASAQRALLDRCQRANLAIYVGTTGDDPDKSIPTALGARFGLRRLDHNRGADEDAITALTVQDDARHRDYIPYSNRPLSWHTDGYYNAPEQQIRGLILHCVHPAEEGGANELLDPEIVYILLRDHDPEHIRALMHPECMAIPAHDAGDGAPRPERVGPVFSLDPEGYLHLRYTHRARNIRWRDDPATVAAVAALREILAQSTPWHFKARLESGWGLLCNNVLHTRDGFRDGARPRLLYRARYYERVAALPTAD